jgi:hypothetical protein
LSRFKSFGEVRNESPAIMQSGQVVMGGEVSEPLFGGDTSLELRKQ